MAMALSFFLIVPAKPVPRKYGVASWTRREARGKMATNVKPGALISRIEPNERRAFALAFACNAMLLGSYYILRPVRDAMSTVLGTQQLPNVYVGTLALTLLTAPLFAWLLDTFKVSR